MKKIINIITLAVAVITIAACGKAKFNDPSFITFYANSISAPESEEIVKIPVQTYGKTQSVVTYQVESVTAIRKGEAVPEKVRENIEKSFAEKGETVPVGFWENYYNYEVVDENGNPDNTNIVQINNGEGAIYLKIKDYTGIYTGNLTCSVILKDIVEGGIEEKGASSTAIVKIIDADGGLSKLIGNYYGEGTSVTGDNIEFTFELDEYDPSEDPEAEYPDANVVLKGGKILWSDGNDMDFQWDIYAYYNENMAELHLYGMQPFNEYPFTGYGTCYVAFGSEGKDESDIIISCGEDGLELKQTAIIWVIQQESSSIIGYYDGFPAGFKWTLNK